MNFDKVAPICSVILVACGCAPTSSTDPDACVAEMTDDSATRLIVQLADGQPDTQACESATSFFEGPVNARPLFPGIDDAKLSRFYLVTGTPAQEYRTPWDTAYAFKRLGEFVSVEPDLEDTLASETARTRAAGACLFKNDDRNPDKAWSLKKIHVADAWLLNPPAGGKRFGEGVRVCHPDTGWTTHDDLDTIDFSSAWNVMNNSSNAEDPRKQGAFLNPGHGTATGSVIGSDGGIASGTGTTPPGEITGVAPAATLVPVRTVNSVVQLFDSDVAQAIAYSVGAQCDVISMSLGGRAFSGLRSAVEYAKDNGLIVVAAAGNCVGFVVAPAAYDDTIAVAATNDEDQPWTGTSKGRSVTIAAPGEMVWHADSGKPSNNPQDVDAGNGTSYSTAEVAGAAALWLAYHGRPTIESVAGSKNKVQDLFIDALTDTARKPNGWNDRKYGAGILNVKELLSADLQATRSATPQQPTAALNESVFLLAQVTDRDEDDIRQALNVMLNDPANLDAAADEWVPELIDIALRDPGAFSRMLDAALAPGRGRAPASLTVDSLVSDSLRTAMQ